MYVGVTLYIVGSHFGPQCRRSLSQDRAEPTLSVSALPVAMCLVTSETILTDHGRVDRGRGLKAVANDNSSHL